MCVVRCLHLASNVAQQNRQTPENYPQEKGRVLLRLDETRMTNSTNRCVCVLFVCANCDFTHNISTGIIMIANKTLAFEPTNTRVSGLGGRIRQFACLFVFNETESDLKADTLNANSACKSHSAHRLTIQQARTMMIIVLRSVYPPKPDELYAERAVGAGSWSGCVDGISINTQRICVLCV